MGREERRAIAFDRATEYYDRTRGLTDTAMEQIATVLHRELHGHRCLEAGVGTGRIGVPLWQRDIDLVGVDLSLPMLLKLRGKRSGAPVVQADATRLPFGDRAFERVLAVHVLHLIADWRAMLDEVARVLVPGGAFIMNNTEAFGDFWDEITERFREAAGIETQYLGVTDLGAIDGYLAERGATPRSLQPTEERRLLTPDDVIGRLEDAQYSFTWRSTPEALVEAGRVVRAWAVERYGSLSDPIENHYVIGWRAYDFP